MLANEPVVKCLRCDRPMERMRTDWWDRGVSIFPLQLVFESDNTAFYAKGDMSVAREHERAAIGHRLVFYACRGCGHVEMKVSYKPVPGGPV